MKHLTGITEAPKQTSIISLGDRGNVVLDLSYSANQMGWFFDLTWGEFTLKGSRVTAFPNLLRQYRNQISFGLACVTVDDRDPLTPTAFSDGSAAFVLLEDLEDLSTVEANHFTRND